MLMIFKGWPNRKKVASPGQPSIDRTWWDKFNNFVSTRAQNAKQMFFAENTFVLAKGCNHIYQFHQPNKVTWRGRGAGVKNKFQGAGPFLAEYMRMIFKGWPHREKVAPPGQPSIDTKWCDKFKHFVSTRAQNAKHMFFVENTFVLEKGCNHICSASPTKKGDLKRPRRRCQKSIPRGWTFFGWIHADDLQRLAQQEKSRITRPTIHR